MTEKLDELPTAAGFRLRGIEMTRIEVFTDAAFAFAVTLLVVSIDAIPNSFADLVTAIQGVPAFAVSFSLLFMFWHAHHHWSRCYGLDDFVTIVLSALLVFLIMIYVYPLKMMSHGIVGAFAALFGFETDYGLAIRSGAELQGLFLIYGIGFVAMCTTIVLCYAHAYRLRARLELNSVEIYDTKSNMLQWSVMAGIGLLSCVLAVAIPGDHPMVQLALPGWTYMLLSVCMPVLGIRADREKRRILASG